MRSVSLSVCVGKSKGETVCDVMFVCQVCGCMYGLNMQCV